MTEQQAAMRQALDWYDNGNENREEFQGMIRQILEQQPADEPVFKFQMQLKPGWGSQYPTPCVIGDPDLRSLFGKVGDVVTFYTSPQPAQQQKPVGEAGTMPGTSGFTMACFKATDVPIGTKLYTSPQPSKPWVGLTEWERGDCVDRGVARGDGWAAILEEVEAKLREKNT